MKTGKDNSKNVTLVTIFFGISLILILVFNTFLALKFNLDLLTSIYTITMPALACIELYLLMRCIMNSNNK